MKRILIGGALAALAATSALAGTPAAVEAQLAKTNVAWAGQNVGTERMRAAYSEIGYRPIWTDGTELSDMGRALVDEATDSYRDGLTPSDYLNGIAGFSEIASVEDAARLEIAMTHAFLTLGQDLFSGVTTPSVTDPNIVIKKKNVDWPLWIVGVSTIGPREMLRTLRPSHPQYAHLRARLSGYRNLMLRGGWQSVSDGETLKPGMTSPRVVELRRNLAARGYDAIEGGETYDEGLKEAVVHFQSRHGLEADGVAGPATFKQINVSASDRVDQIAINLERWRWLPRNLGSRHILVNQAGYELFVNANGKTIDRRRVVVGKPYHQTPMFSDVIEYAEFNPTWTVPVSIATKEMLPKIRKDPSYLVRADYKVYRGWKDPKAVNPMAVDWSAVSGKGFPYRIVQQPGPKNALGQVKFIFPNKFAVYLHDTPSRSLFARAARAFSHGCIRVHKPLELAAKLFSLQGGLDPERIPAIMDGKKTKRVNFSAKLPVHLAYFTAWVNDDGKPLFFDDVYGRDKMVGKYLF